MSSFKGFTCRIKVDRQPKYWRLTEHPIKLNQTHSLNLLRQNKNINEQKHKCTFKHVCQYVCPYSIYICKNRFPTCLCVHVYICWIMVHLGTYNATTQVHVQAHTNIHAYLLLEQTSTILVNFTYIVESPS